MKFIINLLKKVEKNVRRVHLWHQWKRIVKEQPHRYRMQYYKGEFYLLEYIYSKQFNMIENSLRTVKKEQYAWSVIASSKGTPWLLDS